MEGRELKDDDQRSIVSHMCSPPDACHAGANELSCDFLPKTSQRRAAKNMKEYLRGEVDERVFLQIITVQCGIISHLLPHKFFSTRHFVSSTRTACTLGTRSFSTRFAAFAQFPSRPRVSALTTEELEEKLIFLQCQILLHPPRPLHKRQCSTPEFRTDLHDLISCMGDSCQRVYLLLTPISYKKPSDTPTSEQQQCC
eukprot:749225-Hanusia_phi.AAC.1